MHHRTTGTLEEIEKSQKAIEACMTATAGERRSSCCQSLGRLGFSRSNLRSRRLAVILLHTWPLLSSLSLSSSHFLLFQKKRKKERCDGS